MLWVLAVLVSWYSIPSVHSISPFHSLFHRLDTPSYTPTTVKENSVLQVLGSATADTGVHRCLSQLPDSADVDSHCQCHWTATPCTRSTGVFVMYPTMVQARYTIPVPWGLLEVHTVIFNQTKVWSYWISPPRWHGLTVTYILFGLVPRQQPWFKSDNPLW